MSTLICQTVVQSITVICITIAAIYFKNPGLLWWYIIAAMM